MFSKILLKCKNILQTGNVNLTKKISKATLKYIEQIYIPALYVTRITKNKNDSINTILQHHHVVDNNCCVVFHTS